MEHKERNLMSLKAEFHDKGKAARGFKNIMNFIDRNKETELKKLLRFHIPDGVYGQELIERFEIDALLEYYNLLLVAIFAGYVPGKFDEISSKEILAVIRHPSVMPYYNEYYKYKMISYTAEFAEENRYFELEGNSVTISAFNEFISLNRFLKRDKDVELFLGMLDYVWYGDNKISDIINILSSEEKINTAFITEAEKRTKAQCGVWGFIKYTIFLSQLKELLNSIDGYPLLQSSFWMFHGYFFERMNEEMKSIFHRAFENLEESFSNPLIFKNLIEEVYGGEAPEDFNEVQLSEFAANAIRQSREDVDYVLDRKWSDPLRDYFGH